MGIWDTMKDIGRGVAKGIEVATPLVKGGIDVAN